MRLPPSRGRGALALAASLSIPLFFSSLMAATLALEKPLKYEWKGGKHGLLTTWHDPTTATVARVWLWAMVPPLVLVLVGLISTRIPLGSYVACVAAIVIAMAVVHTTATWQRHHTARYPVGVDLVPPTNPASDKFARGQWERMARETSVSLERWTIGAALVSAAVMGGLAVRRRYFGRGPMLDYVPLEGVHGVDVTTPGVGDSSD